MSDECPWLTVVTVVKDDIAGFAHTRTSLLAQDAVGIEHVVIDSSRDRDAIPRLLGEEAGDRLATRCRWVEPAGIYPAMNVGVAEARGEFAYFANAGDALAAPDVLHRVRAAIEQASARWAFGDVLILELDRASVRTPSWDFSRERSWGFSRGHFPPHQGTFARVSDLRDFGGFDASYRVAADYAVFLRLSLLSPPLVLDFVVAEFARGGLSTVAWRESLREFHRARREILRPRGAMAARERLGTARQRVLTEGYQLAVRLGLR